MQSDRVIDQRPALGWREVIRGLVLNTDGVLARVASAGPRKPEHVDRNKAVKMQVEEALKPLLTEIDGLAKEVRGREAAAEALEQTTFKGAPFEEEVAGQRRNWSGHATR